MSVNVNALIRHCQTVTVPDGLGRKSLKLMPWQKEFIRGTFSQDGDAALTIARGGGKTTLCAALADASLTGPIRVAGASTIIVASSFNQGRLAFDQILAGREWNKTDWRVQNSPAVAQVTCRHSGASVKVMGSDARRAHGQIANTIYADEGAQWSSTSDRMIAALRTGLGKVPGSRLIAIGTRPAGDTGDHWFSRMLAGEGVGYTQVHAADPDDDPAAEETWLKANPSLKYFPHLLKRYRQDVDAALANPALLAEWRSLRLNSGCDEVLVNSLLPAGEWVRHEHDGEVERAGPFVLGCDLGATGSMSAAACWFPETGYASAMACFPEKPDLKDRERADGVEGLYTAMEARGELILRGARVSDVGALVEAAVDRWGVPAAVVCDRWREGELRQTLEAIGFPCDVALVVRGMGFHHQGQDCRLFRRAVVDGRVRPEKSLLLRSAMAEARTLTDPAGNSKLAKGHQGGRREKARDDAACALLLAVGEGVRNYRQVDSAAEKVVVF